MSDCKSCGATVRWHKTDTGKNIPLDPAIVEPGTRGAIACSDGHRLSHFSSCPDADTHRARAAERAAAADNAQPWTREPIMAWDLETTGRDPFDARIVTSCALIWPQGLATPEDQVGVYSDLADPGVEIPAEAQAVHGISTDHARTNGRPAADVCESIGRVIAGHRPHPVVGMNHAYDWTVLDAELHRHHGWKPRLTPILDVGLLDRLADQWVGYHRRGARNLAALAEHYKVEPGPAHTAEGDCLTSLRILVAICQRWPQITTMTLSQLWAAQSAEAARQQQWHAENPKPDENGQIEAPRHGWPILQALQETHA